MQNFWRQKSEAKDIAQSEAKDIPWGGANPCIERKGNNEGINPRLTQYRIALNMMASGLEGRGFEFQPGPSSDLQSISLLISETFQ